MYQTFKRKRAIADRGGAQAKYLEKVVAPDKSNSPLGVVAISPDPQTPQLYQTLALLHWSFLMLQLSRPQLQQLVR